MPLAAAITLMPYDTEPEPIGIVLFVREKNEVVEWTLPTLVKGVPETLLLPCLLVFGPLGLPVSTVTLRDISLMRFSLLVATVVIRPQNGPSPDPEWKPKSRNTQPFSADTLLHPLFRSLRRVVVVPGLVPPGGGSLARSRLMCTNTRSTSAR